MLFRSVNDLIAVQKAGAFSVVIEAVPEILAKKLCKMAKIKTIGIGASVKCDGQILVTEDMLGFFSKNAKFVKKYLPHLLSCASDKYDLYFSIFALERYSRIYNRKSLKFDRKQKAYKRYSNIFKKLISDIKK